MERIRLASSVDVKVMPRLEVLYYFVYELAESFGVEEDVLDSIKTGILDGNHAQVREFFDDARKYRDSFSNITPGSFVKRYEISVDVLDKPGSIAVISVLLSSNGINIKNMSIVNNRERENGVLYVSFDSEEQRQKSIDILKSMNYEVQIKN